MFKKLILIICISSFSTLLHSNGIQNVTFQWTTNINFDTDSSGEINIGDKVKFLITLSNVSSLTDSAAIDIGAFFLNIELYNDGTHGDIMSNDNTFTAFWTVKEGTSLNNAVIRGNFWDSDGLKSRLSTKILSFDGLRPVVNNISVSPNAFNPYIHNCKIAYSMTETVSAVIVNIYKDLAMTNLVKSIPRPPAESGDNFVTWWDGKNNGGNFIQTPPDRDYYISITCRDASGNYSTPATASIKISCVKIEIVSFDITPTPVSPDGDDVNDNIYINTKIMMYSWDGITKTGITTNQMMNLGFIGGANWPGNVFFADGIVLNTWPNAKAGFNIYTAGGQNILQFGRDLNPDSDYDQVFVSQFSSIMGGQIADSEAGNDWETLTTFYDDGTAGHEFDYSGGASQFGDGIFTASQSFLIKLSGEWANGTYIVKGEAELTGISWEPGREPGTAHFIPVWKGGYISTEQPAQATFVVDISGVTPIDFTPPSVTSVFPVDNSKVPYSVSAVSAVLDDGAGGSGVDWANSDIYLTDLAGNTIPGTRKNNAVDTISWELDSMLKTSGIYYLYVTPVDIRGNQPGTAYKYSFMLDVQNDSLNLITVANGGSIVDNNSTLYMKVPSYAVRQNTRVSVRKPLFYPGVQQIYSGCQFIPSSLSFKRPVRIILHYTDTDKGNLPPAVPETALRIYNWRSDRWVYLGGTVDTDNMTVTVDGIRDVQGFFAVLPETTGGLPGEIISDVQVDKPFKTGGYISFKISGSITSMKLMIYDKSGYFIKEIIPNINNSNNAGYYDLSWDLTSGNGKIMKNGIYIFRFIAKREDGMEDIVSKAIPVIK